MKDDVFIKTEKNGTTVFKYKLTELTLNNMSAALIQMKNVKVNTQKVILDCSLISYMDSSAMGAMVRIYKDLKLSGKIVTVVVNDTIDKLLMYTGLNLLFQQQVKND